VLVLVPLVYRRCYCGGRALLLFFFRRPRQGGFIQHSAMAGDPCRFGSCGRRQRLAALGRPARSCHRSSPTAGNPRSLCSCCSSFSSWLFTPIFTELEGFGAWHKRRYNLPPRIGARIPLAPMAQRFGESARTIEVNRPYLPGIRGLYRSCGA